MTGIGLVAGAGFNAFDIGQISRLAGSGGGGGGPIVGTDVFSAYAYTGIDIPQAIPDGINLIGNGGTVWTKCRNNAYSSVILNTERNLGYWLASDTNLAATNQGAASISLGTGGYTLQDNSPRLNGTASAQIYVSWTFRNADKFYGHGVVVKTAGSNATVSFANLTALGMVRVKRTDASGSWYVWHKDLTVGNLLLGETVAAQTALGHITVSGTTVTLVDGVIAAGTYLIEAFADDASTGILKPFKYIGNDSGQIINCGFTTGARFVLIKCISTSGNWYVWDNVRGLPASGPSPNLILNSTTVEDIYHWGAGYDVSGFRVTQDNAAPVNADGQTYIGLAIA